MPLNSSFTSYPPTMILFIAHWNNVNTSRIPPLVLKDGQTVAALVAMRDAIEGAISNVNTGAQEAKTVSLDRKEERAALRTRMEQFRRAATYYLEGQTYAKNIASLPPVGASDSAYLAAADTMIYAWTKADDSGIVPGGLKLEGSYSMPDFVNEVAALRAQPLQSATTLLSVADERGERNDLLLPARGVMKSYAAAIRALYLPTSEEVRTLPKLWESSQPDPDAPKLRVEYVAGSSTAKLLWNQVVDPNVVRVFVYIAPGARYTQKNQRRLAELLPAVTSYDLPAETIAPGSTNWVKVVLVDESGDETSSNTVKIARGV